MAATTKKRPRRRLILDVADLQFEVGDTEELPVAADTLPPREVGRAMAVAFDNWCRRRDAAARRDTSREE